MNKTTTDGTYRAKCHMNGCATRFIGVSREEYVEHLREEHGEGIGDLYDTLVKSK